MIDYPMKLAKAVSQGLEASVIVLTTYFHGVSARGAQKNRNRETEPRTGWTELFFRLTEPVWKSD